MVNEFCQMFFLHLLRWSHDFYISFCQSDGCITFINLCMLNHPCTPGMNSTWSTRIFLTNSVNQYFVDTVTGFSSEGREWSFQNQKCAAQEQWFPTLAVHSNCPEDFLKMFFLGPTSDQIRISRGWGYRISTFLKRGLQMVLMCSYKITNLDNSDISTFTSQRHPPSTFLTLLKIIALGHSNPP